MTQPACNVESDPVATQIRGLVAFTEAQNAIYAKASKAKKRVMVASDVLLALRTKRLFAETGTYLDTPRLDTPGTLGFNGLSGFRRRLREDEGGSLQDLLPQIPACNVCAKGAIFVCTVLRQNQVTNGDIANRSFSAESLFSDDGLSSILQGVFSPAQLRKIENEFECRRIYREGPYAVMGLQRFKAKRRMREIMMNIVANGGSFRPKKVRGRPSPSRDDQNH